MKRNRISRHAWLRKCVGAAILSLRYDGEYQGNVYEILQYATGRSRFTCYWHLLRAERKSLVERDEQESFTYARPTLQGHNFLQEYGGKLGIYN